MSLLAAAQAVATRGEIARAAWSDFVLKVQYSNRNLIDPSVQQDPYVTIELALQDGQQLDLGPAPLAAVYGNIVIGALEKEGAGCQVAAKLLDHFISYFERQETTLGTLRTRVAKPVKSFSQKGWEVYPVLIPFWYTRVAS